MTARRLNADARICVNMLCENAEIRAIFDRRFGDGG